jgi:uroporphyrin-III C-methyltransferase / precorrin-2 dehydrogenase / sirohydrochlorin ferrochelatase
MRYFPIFMDLHGQVAVLIGAGKVAERKARLLIQAGACVHVVAREVNAQFSQWIAAGRVLHVALEYQAGLLHGARLVFVATGDAQLNSRVFSDAEQVPVPVNVVDDRKLCRFISPAVVDRSPVQVAISTGGSAPLLARRLRSWIEALLPLGLGQVASAAGDVRRFARERLPKSRRKTVWEKLLGDERLRSFSLQSRRDIGHSMRREIEKAAVDEQAHARQRGRVFLVGAGPGRADLLTLRALHVLAMADVILHDGLVSEEILNLARRDADRINVGKRAGKTHLAQQDIHACMVAEASKGKNVVRLKGGDAFIFGRGGEELQHLRQYDVPYEVVPGITAALACAAYSGIPLTHRDYAQSLTLITGHLATGKESAPDTDRPVIDWAGIAGAGKTAAVYMGVQQAAGIRKALLQAGVDADLPVALVVNGSLDTQFVLHGRIENMAQMAVQAGSDSPGLLIIGQVAALGSSLNWFGESALLQSAA